MSSSLIELIKQPKKAHLDVIGGDDLEVTTLKYVFSFDTNKGPLQVVFYAKPDEDSELIDVSLSPFTLTEFDMVHGTDTLKLAQDVTDRFLSKYKPDKGFDYFNVPLEVFKDFVA